MVKGLCGAVKSNGYDHYITQEMGLPRSLAYIYMRWDQIYPGMPRVVNACKIITT